MKFLVGFNSHPLPPGETKDISMKVNIEGNIRITGFAVSKESSEGFNLVRMRLGKLDTLLAKVPASLFFVADKSRLELLAERIEERVYDVAHVLGMSAEDIQRTLEDVPRTMAPPPFEYVIAKGEPIVLDVENTTSEPKCFRCSFMAEEL